MTNHLSNETSPYLLQHAENPVDWYPWGEEALDKAKREDKPIFLSIGYASCHWCHVMAHESFEDPDVAKVLNQFFVPIKVDREERPDLDTLYMSSVVAMTGQGGWPMSVFLKPTGEPFFAGTYFPPESRYGIPGFKEVLFNIRHIWRMNRKEIDEVAGNTIRHLQIINRFEKNVDGAGFSPESLFSAVKELMSSYGEKEKGWGPAPLFPHPIALEFLLQQYTRNPSPELIDLISDNLSAMARGGLWDAVGGGFHRYSTDDRWLIPHFEKMLYDNAQLARVYLHAFLITRREEFRRVAERTFDFIQCELTSEQGGFYSSLDADSEGEEGAYYIWSEDEIRSILSDDKEWDLLRTLFEMEPSDKVGGRFVLQRKAIGSEMASGLNLPIDTLQERLEAVFQKLRQARSSRTRPGTDDKILAMWNGLTGLAFSEAARYLDRPDFLKVAQANASFLLNNLMREGRLYRSHRRGKTSPQPAFLEDYASLVLFLIDLYQSDHDPRWFTQARELTETMLSSFADETGGLFDSLASDKSLIVRPKTTQDNATPSGSALAARSLLTMAELDDHPDWRALAEDMLASVHDLATAHPLAFSSWLQAADLAVGPVDQVAIVWPGSGGSSEELTRLIWSKYRPRMVAAFSTLPLPEGAPRLLSDRPAINNKAAAYLCRGFTCLQPTSDAAELSRQLAG